MRDIEKEVRDAVLKAADGGSLHQAMRGTILAQARLIAETAPDLETGKEIARHYFDTAIQSLDLYFAESVNGHKHS